MEKFKHGATHRDSSGATVHAVGWDPRLCRAQQCWPACVWPGEAFLVEWLGLDGTVEDAEYLMLEAFEKEGVPFGRGLMPWAQ